MKLHEYEAKREGFECHSAHVAATKYRSVEFSVQGSYFVHQFKVRDLTQLSTQNATQYSIGVVVKENSEVVDLLKVGDVIKMKYYPKDFFLPADLVDTEIRHITKEDQGRFSGHYLIGLAPVDEIPQEPLH